MMEDMQVGIQKWLWTVQSSNDRLRKLLDQDWSNRVVLNTDGQTQSNSNFSSDIYFLAGLDYPAQA